jgi:hypothetical protein
LLVWIKDKTHGWVPRRRTEMKLGIENQFYWSTELGGYVERGKEDEYRARAKPAPPPKATVAPTIPQPGAAPRPRGRKYVDVQGRPLTVVQPVLAMPIPVTHTTPVPTLTLLPKVRFLPMPVYPACATDDTIDLVTKDDAIDLATYDWEATLAEFEATVRGVGWLDENMGWLDEDLDWLDEWSDASAILLDHGTSHCRTARPQYAHQ